MYAGSWQTTDLLQKAETALQEIEEEAEKLKAGTPNRYEEVSTAFQILLEQGVEDVKQVEDMRQAGHVRQAETLQKARPLSNGVH